MATSLKVLITIFLALTISSFTIVQCRPVSLVPRGTESNSLATRLNSGGNSTGCWDSLFKLQACTGEVIQFFYNGETYLGPECCHAVLIIVNDCWPGLLSSLGFTSEEGDILKGYCDTKVGPNPGPNPKPTSPPQAVGPVVEQVMVNFVDFDDDNGKKNINN